MLICKLYRRLCLFLLVPATLGAGSCRKLLDAPAPSDNIDANTVYANDASAEAALIGFYARAMDNNQGILNGNISLYTALSADELGCLNPRIASDSFYLNRLTASNTLSATLFASGYTLIYNLNSILSGLTHSRGTTPATHAQLQGEAKFLRAFLYFYLANLYGGVPLVTGTDYAINGRLPRMSPDSVFALVINDLLNAQQTLPVDYQAAGIYSGNRTRPVQLSATALLARVYLYRRQWALAEQAAAAVIGDPRYRLEPSLDSVFMATSREAVWQLQPVHDSLATADAAFFLPVTVGAFKIPVYNLTPSLLGAFETGDQRQAHWTGAASLGPKLYVYPFKYKQSTYHPGNAEYEMVLRLAEQYLIRAEARARQGNLAGAAADLNAVRVRAGLPVTTAVAQGSLVDALLAERRVELFTEWGHRWLDLKRTGQTDAALGSKPGWQPWYALYPIPGYEVLANPNMTQNPGY